MNRNRTVIYVRTSTSEDQDTKMQIYDLSKYCESIGIQIDQVYEDKGFTGRNIKRPALVELRRACELGEIGRVFVWKFDRLARSLKELIQLIGEFNEFGVTLVSLKDNIDLGSSQGVLMMHILGAFAQFESDLISVRTRSGINYAKANGTRSGRPIGRVRSISRDDRLIWAAYDNFGSMRSVANYLKISKSMVERSLRSRY